MSSKNDLDSFKALYKSYSSIVKELYPVVDFSKIDFSNSEVVSLENQEGEAVTILLDSANNHYISYMMSKYEGKLLGPKLIVIEGHDSVKYFDLESDRLLSLSVKNNVTVGTLLTTFRNDKYAIIPKTFPRAAKAKGCGEGTMACVSDAFTKHGWVSVWATVQSAFIPATAAAIAGVCAAKNCIKNDKGDKK